MAKVCMVKGTTEKRAIFIQEQRQIITVIRATMAISFVFIGNIIPFRLILGGTGRLRIVLSHKSYYKEKSMSTNN